MKVGIFNYMKRTGIQLEKSIKELGFDIDLYDYKGEEPL